VDKPIQLEITTLPEPHSVRMKDAKVMAFSPEFRCNISLPYHIGLGKQVSTGFGVVGKGRRTDE